MTETIEAIEVQPKNELAIAGEKITNGLAAFNERKASLEALAQSAADIIRLMVSRTKRGTN